VRTRGVYGAGVCGIGGVLFHRDDGSAPRRGGPLPPALSRLQVALHHRGPDGVGAFVDDGIALVHTRLALVDVAAGQQPLRTPDGRYALVVNGEIYGHRRRRDDLLGRGAVFQTRSDAEVLLWSLVTDGPAAVFDLEGEFAFCLWDTRERRAWLGRDPVGVKPLVLAHDAGALWFASEAKALLAALPRRRVVDEDALVEVFAAPALSAGRLPFAGFSALPPGVVLEVDAGGSRVVATASTVARVGGDDDIRAAIADAVRDRLDADVEVGAFLSGGLDSSAIVAAVLHERERLRCFSMFFADRTRSAGSVVVDDDTAFVEDLAQQWPIDLVRVRADSAAVDVECDALLASQDRVVAWEQELTQRVLARAAAKDVKAVVVGDAADETWFGYAFALTETACASPSSLLALFGFNERQALLARHLRPRAAFLDERLRAEAAAAGTPFDNNQDKNSLRNNRLAMSTLLRSRWLSRLLHNGDLCTMAFGLEARVPFADRRLRALAAGVDVDVGFCDHGFGPEKVVLRRAVAALRGPALPHAILERRKSALPRDESMAPRWRARCRDLLADARTRERLGAFFDVDAVAGFVAGTSDGDVARGVLFSIVGVAGFLAHHIEPRTEGGAS